MGVESGQLFYQFRLFITREILIEFLEILGKLTEILLMRAFICVGLVAQVARARP